jgi:hypothetical protein
MAQTDQRLAILWPWTILAGCISLGSQKTKAKCKCHVLLLNTSPTDRFSSFDSSKNRGEFKTQIGVKKVIQGRFGLLTVIAETY